MFGIDAQELLVIVIVAVLVIGPKDMPLAMRTAGRWIAKVRRVSNHFRAGLETMIREAEMEEMEKKWAEQNAKIMAEHPADAPPEMEPTGALPARSVPGAKGEDPVVEGSAESRAAAEPGGERTPPAADKQD
ncbi:Sec-independent protein translocase protein TatB [Croceibacterium aestuarii]|uniref:Sec-independent protein translocase protein TatB n=1 Tax=Croceibacterium aestuarii TaxID=3064139 RepID=UPI00272E6FF0|nr:Sec-independent protein translocase protein TatB [Croceibacterium sp. D39]